LAYTNDKVASDQMFKVGYLSYTRCTINDLRNQDMPIM